MATKAQKDRGRRPDIEQDLAEVYHVNYSYLYDVQTSQFDIDRSLKNQARFEPILEDTVEQYQEAVKRGDAFPAVLAYRPGRGANAKLVIIDGNHRLVAHDREKAPIDVYEIDRATKPQTVALMTFAFNTKHGRQTTEEERIHQALYLMDNGATIPDAASAVNIADRVLKRAVSRRNADNRAKETGADMREWDALAQSSKGRLLNISTDEGFVDAIHLAFAARLDANEIFELAALLNSSKSAAKQRALVKSETARYSDRIQEAAGGVLGKTSNRRGMSPKARVQMALGQVLALPDDLSSVASTFAEAERSEAGQRILDASERLRKLAHTIDPDLK